MIGSQEVLADTVLSSREMELLSDIAVVLAVGGDACKDRVGFFCFLFLLRMH